MKRVVNFWSLLGFISVSVFVATEITAGVAAAVWSISGVLHLGTFPTILLGTLIGIPGLYGIIKSTMMAFEAETDPENN
ncbi:hypothetical protein [Chelativorans salis]|uniref:Uncharacterized protein n=1 Tax=Chelativorans salis TaxID=2978478 RepID=A0ABT2LJK3_9HYPH|nr:hypothetical protein [Chelativorans sp. EGI FJ00035]MCT7374678.1 hypothetical protein [Chelativorans sp. EGI FJ00035]